MVSMKVVVRERNTTHHWSGKLSKWIEEEWINKCSPYHEQGEINDNETKYRSGKSLRDEVLGKGV